MKTQFSVIFLDEALEFFEHLNGKEQSEVLYNIQKAKRSVDQQVFKKLHNHIWEFRIEYSGHQIRFFAFWDTFEKSLVLCTHGMFKKSQKTPRNEIEKAEQIRLQYLNRKYHDKK